MMRAFFALLIAGGCASGLMAEDAPPTDRLKLLQQAVEQLEAAGENDLAEPVRQALRRAASQQADLPNRFVLQVTALEIDRARLAVDHPELAAALYLDPSVIPSVASDRELLRQLKKLDVAGGPLKVVAEPSLAATAGRLATYRQGEEFELPIPAGTPGGTAVSKHFFGDRVDATIHRREGHYQADLSVEISRRILGKAVLVQGKEVPSLERMSFSMSAECQLGETQLLTRQVPLLRLSSTKKGEKACTLLAVFLRMDVAPAVAAASSPADALNIENRLLGGRLTAAASTKTNGNLGESRPPEKGYYLPDHVQYFPAGPENLTSQVQVLERYKREQRGNAKPGAKAK